RARDTRALGRRAPGQMSREAGPLAVARHGLAVRGVHVRHLVMPDALDDTRAIFRFLADEMSADTYVNVMDQYYPAGAVGEGRFPELCRRPDGATLLAARQAARAAGLWRLDTRCGAPLHPGPAPC